MQITLNVTDNLILMVSQDIQAPLNLGYWVGKILSSHLAKVSGQEPLTSGYWLIKLTNNKKLMAFFSINKLLN